MQKRALSNTGNELSIIGFGGIIVSRAEQADANNYVAEAIDKGVNYFDVAPTYGIAEERLGPALQGKRHNIFLSCKTGKRTYKEAEQFLHESLKTLRTDYFDLYQFHGVKSLEEVETIFGPNGAMEAILKAQKEGKIIHIGFSAHDEAAAIAMMENFQFTSVLFPVNWASMLNNEFGEKIMATAQQKGVARLAIKALANIERPEDMKREDSKYPNVWYEPIDDEKLAYLALRFTLSQPITAAIPPGDIRLFRMALKIVENFTPITSEELNELQQYASKTKALFPRNR